MTNETKASLQTMWEQLNGALYDLTEGTPSDATTAIEDCIERLESLGINIGE
jgi:hypothetical protein